MKIVHVITGISFGGAQMMLYKLLSRLDPTAYRAEVISLVDIGPIGKKVQELGVPVRALGMRSGVP
ncbi:MAG: glycosyltransferase family 4 protein, partial [Candidatus Binatia bacterium]